MSFLALVIDSHEKVIYILFTIIMITIIIIFSFLAFY